eukprot:EG_transcript_32806
MTFVLLALLCLVTKPPTYSQYTATTLGLRPAVSSPLHFHHLHSCSPAAAARHNPGGPPAAPAIASAASLWSTWARPGCWLTGLLAGLTVAAWTWRRLGSHGEQPPMALATVPRVAARPPEDFDGDPALCAAGRVLEEAFRASAPGAPGVWPGGEEGVW